MYCSQVSQLLTGQLDAEARVALAEEREKANRVEVFCQQAARRMKNQDVVGAWTAWQEQYYEQVRQRQLLKSAGARLSKPQLVVTFAYWRDNWEGEERERLDAVKNANAANLIKRCSELDAALRSLRDQQQKLQGGAEEKLRVALEKQRIELSGNFEEQQALIVQQERASRIELACQQAVRRMKNQDVVGAWMAWQVKYYEQVRQRQLLKSAGARLSKPQLVATFSRWQDDWERAQLFRTSRAKQGQVAEVHQRCSELEEEIRELERVSERQLAAEGERLSAALEKQRVELSGSLEEQQALFEAEEKANRVEVFCQQAARRMKNQDVVGAWTAWQEQYYEQVRQRQLLKSAGARLSKPQLVATFAYWCSDWEGTMREKQLANHHERMWALKDQHTQQALQLSHRPLICCSSNSIVCLINGGDCGW